MTPETGFAISVRVRVRVTMLVPSSGFRRHKIQGFSFHGVLCSMESVWHINTLWAVIYCTEKQSMASLVAC